MDHLRKYKKLCITLNKFETSYIISHIEQYYKYAKERIFNEHLTSNFFGRYWRDFFWNLKSGGGFFVKDLSNMLRSVLIAT